nr:M28 family peptidase [Saprospiraceae bacterium]
GFPHHWHTQKDNMDAIDPLTLDAVGKVLVKLIYLEEANKI